MHWSWSGRNDDDASWSGSARVHLIQEIVSVLPPSFLDGQSPLKFAPLHLNRSICLGANGEYWHSLSFFFRKSDKERRSSILFSTTRHS
jgi:hypothetical protein